VVRIFPVPARDSFAGAVYVISVHGLTAVFLDGEMVATIDQISAITKDRA